MGSLIKATLKFLLFPLLIIAVMSSPAVLNAATLDLTWNDNSTNEDGFGIDRKPAGSGSYTQIGTVGPDTTSYSDVLLTDGMTYCYRLRAFNSNGNSPDSNEACATATDVDTDGDGLPDDVETNTYGTDPLLADTDGDGFSDFIEINQGSDPLIFASTPTSESAIVLGLGSGGGGWIETISSTSPHEHISWLQVPWANYNSAVGETRPVLCDVDGDGKNEIVIGLGSYPSDGGWLEVKDDANAGYAHLAWIRVRWKAYNDANGETFPACGDIIPGQVKCCSI